MGDLTLLWIVVTVGLGVQLAFILHAHHLGVEAHRAALDAKHATEESLAAIKAAIGEVKE